MLQEKAVLGDAVLEVLFESEKRYRLSYGDAVIYENGSRRVMGRKQPHEFRSVEQLRYDFERDVKVAGGSLGEAA
jgi:hypothetical protein